MKTREWLQKYLWILTKLNHDDETLLPIARAAAERAAGPGVWIDAFVQPFVYLSPAALVHEKRAAIEAADTIDFASYLQRYNNR
jgi:hypothetical protein